MVLICTFWCIDSINGFIYNLTYKGKIMNYDFERIYHTQIKINTLVPIKIFKMQYLEDVIKIRVK